jgi:hypothetical protein
VQPTASATPEDAAASPGTPIAASIAVKPARMRRQYVHSATRWLDVVSGGATRGTGTVAGLSLTDMRFGRFQGFDKGQEGRDWGSAPPTTLQAHDI